MTVGWPRFRLEDEALQAFGHRRSAMSERQSEATSQATKYVLLGSYSLTPGCWFLPLLFEESLPWNQIFDRLSFHM